MFLRGRGDVTLFVIFCFFVGATENFLLFWDVTGRVLSIDEVGHQPLLRTTNLSLFTIFDIRNFDGRHNFGQLLTNLPNVQALTLRHCDLAIINKVFAGKTLSKIKSLAIRPDGKTSLNGCSNITDVAPVFTVTKAFLLLEEFGVYGHRFKTISRQFAPSPNLKKLWIESAGLERLPGNFFVRYKALEGISLLNNRLASLPVDAFAGNIELKFLQLNLNRLAELPEQIFQRNIKLQELWLTHNRIKSLPERLLMRLSDLEVFSVENNQISTIPPRFFASNHKLRRVSFGFNQIQRLLPKLFAGLTELQEFWFNFNKIKSLGAGLFKDCGKLTWANFQSNQINKIAPDVFHVAAPLGNASFNGNPCIQYWDSSDISQCKANWEQTTDALVHDKSSCATLAGKKFSVGLTAPAPRREYPWSAALFFEDEFQCGASLISRKHVLTAAHCYQDSGKPKLTDADRDKFSVKFGRNDLTDDDELSDARSRKIAEFILHPDWDVNSFNYDGDVAIGVLTNAINTFTDLIRPICLNEKAIDTLHGEQGKVVGWGSTDEVRGSGWSNISMEFKVTIVSNEDCEQHDAWLTALTSGTAFCAGNLTTSAACKGDSGGALFLPDKEDGNKYKAVGIVSAALVDHDGGRQCNINNYQLYTDVTLYRTWIWDILIETY